MILEKTMHFDAAHRLYQYDGKCGNIHGHRWKVELKIETFIGAVPKLHLGMLVDFGELKRRVVDVHDHKLILNSEDPLCTILAGQTDIVQLEGINPTAENFAMSIARAISAYLAERDIAVHVTARVWESETASAEVTV